MPTDDRECDHCGCDLYPGMNWYFDDKTCNTCHDRLLVTDSTYRARLDADSQTQLTL